MSMNEIRFQSVANSGDINLFSMQTAGGGPEMTSGAREMTEEGTTVQGSLSPDRSSWQGTRGSSNVEEPMRSSWRWDSNRWSDGRPLEGAHTRARAGAARVPFASFNGDRDRLFDCTAVVRAVGNVAVSLQDHHQGVFQVSLGFGQGSALGVDAGDFFHVAEIPLAPLEVDSGELANHRTDSITERVAIRQHSCGNSGDRIRECRRQRTEERRQAGDLR